MTPGSTRGVSTAWSVIRARYEEPLATGLAGGVLVAAVLLPLGVVIFGAQFNRSEPDAALRAFGYLGTMGGFLLRSVALSASVTLLACAIGIPLGALLAKTDVAGRRGALVVHAFPMFLPPFLLALGWFYLFGRESVLGTELTSAVLFGPVGAVVVMSLAFAPVFTCLTMLGLSGVDPTLEEAARLVASPAQVLGRILLPAARPAVTLAALVVFTLAFSELGVPMFLRVRVYPGAVFSRLGGISYAPGEAALLVLPLLGVALVLLALERTLLGERSFAVLGLREREGVPVTPLGRWRLPATLGVWCLAALSLLPIAGLMVKASHGGILLVPRWIGRSVENSLLSASVAALAIMALSLVLGRAVARRRPGAQLLDSVAVLAFVTPAPLLGVGLISLWNRPATSAVYGTLAIVVLGYIARYSAIGVRTVASTIAQSLPSLEEAAAVSGATFLRRLCGIVAPTSARGLAAGALLVFVFCFRDLETAVLYYPPGGEPLPVRILTLEANGPEPVVAALALVHVAATAATVAIGGALLLRGRRR
jgi:iron(III) transport system permease protein